MNRTITLPLTKQVSQSDNYEKGQQFEKYIKEFFNERSFWIDKWHMSKKIPDGTYSSEFSYPDLELVFRGRKHHPFAVECKWRRIFNEGKIKWAERKQISKYLEFQKLKGYRVFVAIGIGGEAFNPERLFVTPLNNICGSIYISENDLLPYNRKPTRRFFYDTCQLKLF